MVKRNDVESLLWDLAQEAMGPGSAEATRRLVVLLKAAAWYGYRLACEEMRDGETKMRRWCEPSDAPPIDTAASS